MILDHVTAIVRDADAVSSVLALILGRPHDGETSLPGMSIRTFSLGGVELHVNAPTGPGPVADFYAARGAALHHLALRVDDLDEAMARLAERGLATMGPAIVTAPGIREVFLDPHATGGLMIQLVERRADVAPSDLDPDAVTRLAAQVPSPAGPPEGARPAASAR